MSVEEGGDALSPPVILLGRQTPGLDGADGLRPFLDEFPDLPVILVLPPQSWRPEEQQALKERIEASFEDNGTSLHNAALQADHDPEPSRDRHPPPARTAPPRPHGGLAGWQIRRLSAYVDEHLHETIHVRDLAALTGLSIGHFAHAFKQSFGEPPLAHVTHRRLARACEQMLTSNVPLAWIAQECGFCDQSHFSRHFHRAMGMTPQRWRRLNSPGPR